MIAGFVVLGLLFYDQTRPDGRGPDRLRADPAVGDQRVRARGLTGLLLAGLVAAFVGTFAGTLNAAQAYIVNDLYHQVHRPQGHATGGRLLINYASGLLLVVVSIVLGFFAKNVNNLLQWIVSGL